MERLWAEPPLWKQQAAFDLKRPRSSGNVFATLSSSASPPARLAASRRFAESRLPSSFQGANLGPVCRSERIEGTADTVLLGNDSAARSLHVHGGDWRRHATLSDSLRRPIGYSAVICVHEQRPHRSKSLLHRHLIAPALRLRRPRVPIELPAGSQSTASAEERAVAFGARATLEARRPEI